MGSNLPKLPLLAVCYAALLSFCLPLFPFSPAYSEALASARPTLSGSLLLLAYALWVCLAVTLVFSMARGKNAGQLPGPLLLALLGAQLLGPSLQGLLRGSPVMERGDILLRMAAGAICGLLLLLLSALLLKSDSKAPDSAAKYKTSPLGMVIRIVALSCIFCVLFLLLGYFLLWTSLEARLLYGGGEQNEGFVRELVKLLWYNATIIPVALLQGLVPAAFSLPLLGCFHGKKTGFVAVLFLLFSSTALFQLVPSPFAEEKVRFAQFIFFAALYGVYAFAAGLILYGGLKKQAAAIPPEAAAAGAKTAAGAKPAQTPAKPSAAPVAAKK